VNSNAAMTDYRAYIVGQNGHLLSVIELDCLCDEAAIQAAKRYAVGHSVELWSGTRFISLLHHEPD
jgi:hypothetical protein